MRRFLRMGACVATLCWGGGALAQTMPVPQDTTSWVLDRDYPAEALRRGEGGTTEVELQVDPAGKPVGCRVIVSSNSAVLDAATCRLMVERGKFRPATDATGKAIAGMWPMRFTWIVPRSPSRKSLLRSFAQIEQLTWDAAGRISACSTRKVGDLGIQMAGCQKIDGEYALQRVLGNRYRNSVMTIVTRQEVEGDLLPADAPDTNLRPDWTTERTFTVQPDGSVGTCYQRESGKAPMACTWPEKYLPLADGLPRQVRAETRWAFQPDK